MPFRSEQTKLTRQQLYDRMWSTPARSLAKEFGLSDVGLAKTCTRHKIPRPPRGYWAQLAFGKRPKKVPLPKVNDPELEEVVIFRQQFFDGAVHVKDVRPEKPSLVVPDELSKPHPLVAATRTSLKSANAGENGTLYPDVKSCLHVFVTKSSIDRAMRICNTFVKYWESIGGTFTLGKKNFRTELETSAELNGDQAAFTLTEQVKRTTVKPDPSRPWDQQYGYHPTGHLVLEVDHYGDGLRRRWGDGTKQKLEDILGSFVVGLQAIIEDVRLKKLDDECGKRQSERLMAIREQEIQRKKAEDDRRTSLMENIAAWRKANEIRAYLTECVGKIQAGELAVVNQKNFNEWIDWGWWYADFCDPLATPAVRPDSVRQCMNIPIGELDVTRRTRAIIGKLGVQDTDGLSKVTRKEFDTAWGQYTYGSWDEVCKVLEFQGYDVSRHLKDHSY